MATETPKRHHRQAGRLYVRTGMLLVFALSVFFACSDSSKTRSEAKQSVGTTYNIVVHITSPQNGDTVAWYPEDATATPIVWTTDTKFGVAASGGSGDYTFTWRLDGPSSSLSANGDAPEITFMENGNIKVTVTAVDTKGISGSDTIYITSKTYGTTLLEVTLVQPTATTFSLGETVTTQVDVTGGTGSYAYLWKLENAANEAFVTPSSSANATQVWGISKKGTYQFNVTVTDTNTGETIKGSVTVTVI